jgi:L-malate glycosyltransferase
MIAPVHDFATIVAIGPFEDGGHAEHLAAAFALVVRERPDTRLVLVGGGMQCGAIMRWAFTHGLGKRVQASRNRAEEERSKLIAAATLVVASPASGVAELLEVLAMGTPVVAPANPTAVRLVAPAVAGLVHRPGDVTAMAAAMLRLLTMPTLRHGMSCRAAEVAQRTLAQCGNGQRNEGKEDA